MNLKDFLYQEMFTTATEALELFNQSTQTSFNFDAFGEKNVFTAVVLSKPIVLVHAAKTTASDSTKSYRQRRNSRIQKFAFKARIIDDPSPHGYLPEPCLISLVKDPEEELRKIFLHTTFISSDDYNLSANNMPSIGDKVFVRLTGNVFSYNLQFGEFVSIDKLSSTDLAEAKGMAGIDKCSAVDAFFEGGKKRESIKESIPDDPVGFSKLGSKDKGCEGHKWEELYELRGHIWGANTLAPDITSNSAAHAHTAVAAGRLAAKAYVPDDSKQMLSKKRKLLRMAKCCHGPDHLLSKTLEKRIRDTEIIVEGSNRAVVYFDTTDQKPKTLLYDVTYSSADADSYIKALGVLAFHAPEKLCLAQLILVERFHPICTHQAHASREIHRRDPKRKPAIDKSNAALTDPKQSKVRYQSGWAYYSAGGAALRRTGNQEFIKRNYHCHQMMLGASGRSATQARQGLEKEMAWRRSGWESNSIDTATILQAGGGLVTSTLVAGTGIVMDNVHDVTRELELGAAGWETRAEKMKVWETAQWFYKKSGAAKRAAISESDMSWDVWMDPAAIDAGED